jgi:hypothetical protein
MGLGPWQGTSLLYLQLSPFKTLVNVWQGKMGWPGFYWLAAKEDWASGSHIVVLGRVL